MTESAQEPAVSGPTGPTGPDEPSQLVHVIVHHDSWHALVIRHCTSKKQALETVTEIMQEHPAEIWDEMDVHIIYGVELTVTKPRHAIVIGIDSDEHVLFQSVRTDSTGSPPAG